jgi:hypothetical protein
VSRNVDGTFTYTPALGTVLDAGTHTLSVTFKPTDPDSLSVTKTVKLIVDPGIPTVIWDDPANIPYGTPLTSNQLNATAKIDGYISDLAKFIGEGNAAIFGGSRFGTFSYVPELGTHLDIGANTLSVTFTPFDTNYITVTKTVTITVDSDSSQMPTITWPTPDNITYGQTLGDAQLNASASTDIPGSLKYSPAAGTLLAAGTHTLTVTFT